MCGMLELGPKIKALRKENGLTQQQLADKLGVSKGIVSAYENSSRYPSYDVLIKLALEFYCTVDYLLGLEHRHSIHIEGLSEENLQLVVRMVQALAHKK